jgi:hypothetical protein
MELSQLKDKGHVQSSQVNSDNMVMKLENGSIITLVHDGPCIGEEQAGVLTSRNRM